MKISSNFISALAASVSIICFGSVHADAMTLKEAVQLTLTTNPQILQAAKNREATEFELRQARGLNLPSVDLEAGYGKRRLASPTSGGLSSDHEDLSPADVRLTITQPLFDGGAARAEIERQASRVDGASFRVSQRSEALALEAVQAYLEYLLQAGIVAAAQQNRDFHNQILADIGDSIQGGTLTDADLLQGRERQAAAKARLLEAQQELEATKIRFLRVVGAPISNPSNPPSVAKSLPKTLDDAVFIAKNGNPQIAAALADVDAADAQVRGARANYLPKVNLEIYASTGNDVGGSQGNTNDVQARVVARWNLFRGGIDTAREQEQIRRAGEQRMALYDSHREVEQSVRSAWNERVSRGALAGTLSEQSSLNANLVNSYREQFKVGQRSLLDVLDAQNTRFNTSVSAQTARLVSVFAEYKILAAMGNLVSVMNGVPVGQANQYARREFQVAPTVSDPKYVEVDSRQTANMPFDLLAPIRSQ